MTRNSEEAFARADLPRRLEIMSLSYCPTLPRHKIRWQQKQMVRVAGVEPAWTCARHVGGRSCLRLPGSFMGHSEGLPLPYLFKSTTATLFTPLHARYSLRSDAATMFRTTPPPDGIVFALKLSDLGSNLTKVLGVTPDSLYQTSPSFVIAIPYGSDSAPRGEFHSFNSFPLAGSKWPRYPRYV